MRISLFSCLLFLVAPLFWASPAFSQDPVSAATAATAVSANVPAPSPPAVLVAAAKVTARKEDEEEKEPEQKEAAFSPENLSWFQRGVARVAGVPTEASNSAAMQQMSSVLAALQTSHTTLTALNATLTADNARMAEQIAQADAFLTQLREAPATLRAADPAALTPAQAEITAAASALASAELRACSHPPGQLPGPGAQGGNPQQSQDAIRSAFSAEKDPLQKAVLARQMSVTGSEN